MCFFFFLSLYFVSLGDVITVYDVAFRYLLCWVTMQNGLKLYNALSSPHSWFSLGGLSKFYFFKSEKTVLLLILFLVFANFELIVNVFCRIS